MIRNEKKKKQSKKLRQRELLLKKQPKMLKLQDSRKSKTRQLHLLRNKQDYVKLKGKRLLKLQRNLLN